MRYPSPATTITVPIMLALLAMALAIPANTFVIAVKMLLRTSERVVVGADMASHTRLIFSVEPYILGG